MKRCSRCQLDREDDRFLTDHRNGRLVAQCKDCARDRQREFRRRHGQRLSGQYSRRPARWRAHIKRTYGLSAAEYDALLAAQGGVCAICHGHEIETPNGRLHVDHDHATRKVRGLLCAKCNRLLGTARDNAATLRAAADYLEIVAPQAIAFIEACLEVLDVQAMTGERVA